MYKYSDDLTELQKEFILDRKESRKHILLRLLFIVVIIIVSAVIGFVSWFINEQTVLAIPENLDNWKYVITYITILTVIACIIGVIYGVCCFVKYCQRRHKATRFDFKVRGILSSEEYKYFIGNSYEIRNFNSVKMDTRNDIKSKLDSESFNKHYNLALMYVGILRKLYNAKITPEEIYPLYTYISDPLNAYWHGLNDYKKVIDTFDEITELIKKGDYKFYFENWELKRYD